LRIDHVMHWRLQQWPTKNGVLTTCYAKGYKSPLLNISSLMNYVHVCFCCKCSYVIIKDWLKDLKMWWLELFFIPLAKKAIWVSNEVTCVDIPIIFS
jgi:hypothetical protein